MTKQEKAEEPVALTLAEPPEISAEDRKAGLDAIRRSMMYRLMCWDEATKAEKLLRRDLDTTDFDDLISCMNSPKSCLRISDADVLEMIGEKPDAVFLQYPGW